MSRTLFGRSYTQVGSTSSDFLIQTKGKIKAQIGNKFIDLIKDSSDTNLVHKVSNQSDIGKQGDGIYVLDGGIVIYTNNQSYPLDGISYNNTQNLSQDQKIQAQQNIGIYYNTLDDAQNVTQGFVYIEDQSSFYYIKDGQLQKWTIEYPSTLTKQLIIQKSDSNIGAIYIIGEGKENSLSFTHSWIYESNDQFVTNSNYPYSIQYQGNEIITIGDTINVNNNITFNQKVLTNNIQSLDGSFSLTTEDGKSTLKVDNIVLSNPEVPIGTILLYQYNGTTIPDGWHLCDGQDNTPLLQATFVQGNYGTGFIPSNKINENGYTLVYIIKIK